MSITINNQELLLTFFLFFISWFFTALFIKSGAFFKVCIFFLSFAIFIPLEQWNDLTLTLASFLGVLTAYYGGFLNVVSSIKNYLTDAYYFLIDILSSSFSFFNSFFSGIGKAIIFIISFFNKLSKSNKRDSSSSSHQPGNGNNKNNSRDYEEQRQRAKEDFKRAREEARQREERENQDNRSFEEIIGVHSGYSKSDLKTAYKRSVSKFHPDKYSHMSENFRTEAEQEFKKIQKSYNILSGRLG